jgi:hypothetical protein
VNVHGRLCVQPGEVTGPLHLLVQAVPGPDLDPAVMPGIGHDQLLIGRALVHRRGELETLPVHAVAAGPGLTRSGTSLIEDSVPGDADQQLDIQTAQGMCESSSRISLVLSTFQPGAALTCR